MKIQAEPEVYACPSCHVGRLRRKELVFFDLLVGWPIIAQHFPGWSCLLCGYHAYDPDALMQVQAMLWNVRDLPSQRSANQSNPEGESPLDHKDHPQHLP
jgi:hypothetical protein